MMADLQDLFSSVDGLTEDLTEFGIMAGSAVAANIAFNAAVSFGLSKWTTAPEWVSKYVVPGAAIVGGALAGGFAGKYVGRRVATGVAVGLMTAGLTQFVKQFAPSQVTQYLNGVDEELSLHGGSEVLMGLGEGSSFDKYLSGASVSVESVNGATMSVESVNGLNGGRPSYAAAFQ